MDYGTIAIISSFHMAVDHYKKKNSRQSKKSLKRAYLQLISSLKGELKRNSISKPEFDAMIKTYEEDYKKTITKQEVT